MASHFGGSFSVLDAWMFLPLKLDPQFVQELSHTWGLFARFVLSIVASHTLYCKNWGTDEIVVFPNDALKKRIHHWKNWPTICAKELLPHLKSIGRIFNGGLPPSQWAGWHKGGRLNLYSAFWRSHAHCAECPSTSPLCICICICICSVQSVRLGGELRCMCHLP